MSISFEDKSILTNETMSSKQRHKLRGQLRLMSKLKANNWNKRFNRELSDYVTYMTQTDKKFAPKLSRHQSDVKIRSNRKAEVITTNTKTKD